MAHGAAANPYGAERRSDPVVVHGGAEAGAARVQLEALGLAPPPIVEQGPPPPDVAMLFRRDLTAIEDRTNGRQVLLVDAMRPYQRRVLRVGDVYQDGWRVARIEPQSVVLRRRREVRTIDVFALPVIEP